MITNQEIINSKVMALSWKQPYADLMLHGKIETRSWPTKYRGLVLICSSKNRYGVNDMLEISGVNCFTDFLKFIKSRSFFHQGKAIAVGRLVDCRPMQPEDEALTLVKYRKPWVETRCRGKKKQYKLVECQLWCHVYEDITPIEPFDWTGTQGWKELSDEEKLFIEPYILI